MLASLIRAEIEASGLISFRRFMELALYHPEYGYYAAGEARVGRKGDFFTNVSVGPLYGRLLAIQVSEMWRASECPANFTIVEQGANTGDLAVDVLVGLQASAPDCFEAVRYRIVEPAVALEAKQRAALAAFAEKVTWAHAIEPFTGVHLSNELPDAFPVHVVRWDGAQWRERMVQVEGEAFVFADAPITDDALAAACARIPLPLPEGYTTEVNLAASAWITEVAGSLQRGWVLLVDYGYLREDYYSPGRTDGTLSAYAAHRRERDVLAQPGVQDLTAHVEFTSLIEAASAAGLKLEGFTDQHHFVVGLGAVHFADDANPGDVRAFKTLMHPQFMGLAFKVAVFSKGVAGKLSGLSFARPLEL